MRTLSKLFAGTTAITTVFAAVLGGQLHAERKLAVADDELKDPALAAPHVAADQRAPILQADGAPIVTSQQAAQLKSVVNTAPIAAAGVWQQRNPYQTLMQLRYPDLAKEFGLTQSDAERVFDLMMLRSPNHQAVEALLGPSRTGQWHRYWKTLEPRRRVSELDRYLSSISPLSEAQSKLLFEAVADEQLRREADNQDPIVLEGSRAQLELDEHALMAREDSNRRLVDSARSFLDGVQLEAMERSIRRQNDNARTTLEARRTKMDAGGQ